MILTFFKAKVGANQGRGKQLDKTLKAFARKCPSLDKRLDGNILLKDY